MYLINIHTQELEEFIQSEVPPYVILSHRWGSQHQELNFREVLKKRIDRQKEGYTKLTEACRIAAGYDVKYIWIDTCCIDKKSSAELSEAINSMFSWYRDAKVCLAHLHDVSSGSDLDESFSRSDWFTRAWTLQELLAPKDVEFFDSTWKHIGVKSSRAEAIEAVTGIAITALRDPSMLLNFRICERMSWASDRHATRPEDIAYSLMGIFDINMPLLYGEGTKAFTRLQEEIIRRANEPTFLLWGLDNTNSNLIASSPVDFRHARGITKTRVDSMTPFTLTNIGLEIEVALFRYRLRIYGTFIGHNHTTRYAVLLRKYNGQSAFYRIGVAELERRFFPNWRQFEKITILRPQRRLRPPYNRTSGEPLIPIEYSFHVRIEKSLPIFPLPSRDSELHVHDYRLSVIEIEGRWSKSDEIPGLKCTFFEPSLPGVARMTCRLSDARTLWLELSFDFDSCPCLLLTGNAGAMESRRNSRKPAVWELSDPSSNRRAPMGREIMNWDEVELLEILDDAPRFVSYFLRTDTSHSRYARLPPDLAPMDCPVWVKLARPRDFDNLSDSWLLIISRTEPGHRGLPDAQIKKSTAAASLLTS